MITTRMFANFTPSLFAYIWKFCQRHFSVRRQMISLTCDILMASRLQFPRKLTLRYKNEALRAAENLRAFYDTLPPLQRVVSRRVSKKIPEDYNFLWKFRSNTFRWRKNAKIFVEICFESFSCERICRCHRQTT